MRSVAFVTSHALSFVNFRVPLIRELIVQGFGVYVLAPNFDAQIRREMLELDAVPVDYTLVRTGVNPFCDLRSSLELYKVFKRIKPDIVVANFVKPVIFGTLAAWLAGVRRRVALVEGLGFVYTFWGRDRELRRMALKTLVGILYRVGLSRAHLVVFLNPDDRAELSRVARLDERKTLLLGGIGVDLEKWPLLPPELRRITFLLVARLLVEKGVREYIAAARIIRCEHPEVRFVLLGGLDEHPAAINEAEIKGWVEEGIVEWPGHVSVLPWLKMTSVYVLPSYREGVPVSTQEAMAVGRAIITTDVPGCRETVVNGVNGFIVPVRDHVALADKMKFFIENPDAIRTMGSESRKIAESRFDVRKVNARLLSRIHGLR